MFRARALAVAVLLVFYGAVGARQPAVRTSVPLPAAASAISAVTGVDPDDRGQLLLHLIRLLFDAPDGQSAQDAALRSALAPLLASDPPRDAVTVPLPLDPSIWRETILQRNVPDTKLVAAILSDRNTALLYHGLASLDDETLGWLGPDRETLVFLRRHAGAFAVFGRSIRVRAGQVAVPGGDDAVPFWRALVGAEPARPAAFVQRIFRDDRLAWFYDTLAHLEPAALRFVLGNPRVASSNDRLRELASVFASTAKEWSPGVRAFNRPAVDPGLVLSVLEISEDGTIAGPSRRNVWERVFRDTRETDFIDVADEGPRLESAVTIDATWIVRRTSMVSPVIGRRRLDTLLFAQRVFRGMDDEDQDRLVATALRGVHAFPALMLTLERIGVTEPGTYVKAARHAAAIDAIQQPAARLAALAQFQSAVGVIDRARRAGGIPHDKAVSLITSLLGVDVAADDGYGSRFSEWLQKTLVPAFATSVGSEWTNPEDIVLAAVSGIRDGATVTTVEWEGRQYAVDPARAELKRLQRIRQHQQRREQKTGDLAGSLIEILYATCLGDADGAGARAADVARRHDFSEPWRLPREDHSGDAWRVRGSVLGLDAALARLALRRLDTGEMPAPPTLSTMERVTAMMSVALMSPADLTDQGRDEVAAAIRRGRARVQNLTADRAELDRIARDAGISEWRREALGWTLEHDRAHAQDRFSMVELFWLGAPRRNRAIDGWGAATLALDGALALRMPPAIQWELRAGRPANGQLATRGADVTLRIAEVLSDLRLPASLAPGVVSFAMQDVIDAAQPAYFDDWGAFERIARALTRDRIADYVAALAASGPLVPATSLQDKN